LALISPQLPSVLVTGAAGFTGLALAISLLSRGYPLRALVRDASRARTLKDAGAEIIEGDIRDPAIILQAVAGVHTVYHLAAVFRRAGVPDSEYHEVHVDATRRLVEESAAAGVTRFLHCSTVGVHGDVEADAPANEDAPLHPGDIYQVTKLEGEQVARDTAEQTGLPLTVVRPGPIYGPGDRRLYKLIGGVAKRRFMILGDGDPHFQRVYVDDLVEGFQLAANTPEAVGRTYIITGGQAPTLNELVHEIADVAHVPAPRV
jgi:nucleoside-diphosphate-sugar epimerase